MLRMLVRLQLNITEIGLNKPCINNTGAMALLKPVNTLLVKNSRKFNLQEYGFLGYSAILINTIFRYKSPEDGDSGFLRNVCTYLTNYTVSLPTKQQTQQLP